MGLSLNISSPDLTEQVKKFGAATVNKIIDRFSRPAMNNSVKIMLTGWRDIAAVDTGRYKNTLKTEVKTIASGRILQGAVRTFAASRTGFPFPRALENSVRYHYRSTKRQGQRTAGKLAMTFKANTPTVIKQFANANDKIVKALAVK